MLYTYQYFQFDQVCLGVPVHLFHLVIHVLQLDQGDHLFQVVHHFQVYRALLVHQIAPLGPMDRLVLMGLSSLVLQEVQPRLGYPVDQVVQKVRYDHLHQVILVVLVHHLCQLVLTVQQDHVLL